MSGLRKVKGNLKKEGLIMRKKKNITKRTPKKVKDKVTSNGKDFSKFQSLTMPEQRARKTNLK